MLNSRKPSFQRPKLMTLTSGAALPLTPNPHAAERSRQSRYLLLYQARQAFIRVFQRSRPVWFMLLLSLLLSGCVSYDVGVRFESANRGELVQHIQIEERLKRFSGSTAQQWLTLIEARSRRLGGRLKRLPDNDLLVTIPFTSSGDLQTKFNQFFSSLESDGSTATAIALPTIASQFNVSTSNFLLAERNHLRYQLDLRALGVLSSNGSLLLSPASLINLEFRLHTPWGARSSNVANLNQPEGQVSGKTLVWQLVPGELNDLDVVFWLPSPLGIGALAIVFLVVVGSYLKYPRSPLTVPDSTTAV